MPELNEQQKQKLFDSSKAIANEYEYLKLTYPKEPIAENYLVVQWQFFYGDLPQKTEMVERLSTEAIDRHVFAIASKEWIDSRELANQILKAAGIEGADLVKSKIRMRLQALVNQGSLERHRERKYIQYRLSNQKTAPMLVKPNSNRAIALELLTLAGGGKTVVELAAFAESISKKIKFDLRLSLDGLKRDRLIMAERDGRMNRYWLPHQRQSVA